MNEKQGLGAVNPGGGAQLCACRASRSRRQMWYKHLTGLLPPYTAVRADHTAGTYRRVIGKLLSLGQSVPPAGSDG